MTVAVQGLYALSDKTSCRKISWSLDDARIGFSLFQSLWYLTGTSATVLPRCLSKFRAIRWLWSPITRLWDFTGSCGKTSYRPVNRGPGFGWNRAVPNDNRIRAMHALQRFLQSMNSFCIIWLIGWVICLRLTWVITKIHFHLNDQNTSFDTRAHFAYDLSPVMQFWWKIPFAVIFLLAVSAAVVRADLYGTPPLDIWMAATRNIHWIWITMEKPFVKRMPVIFHNTPLCHGNQLWIVVSLLMDIYSQKNVLVSGGNAYRNFHEMLKALRCMWQYLCRFEDNMWSRA